MSQISLVINAKNEENLIEACILSARNIVDEIIVFDLHSTDRTAHIAKTLGAVVYSTEEFECSGHGRNTAFEKATNEWILLLDAVEQLTTPLSAELAAIAKENKYDAVSIATKNIHFGKWTQHGGWWPGYKIRLFKKSRRQLGGESFVVAESSENILTLPAQEEMAVIHDNGSSVDQFMERWIKYSKSEHNLNPQQFAAAADFIDFFEGEFNKRFLLDEGFKDGLHGFMLSKFMEFSRFVEVARLWEKLDYADITNVEDLSSIKEPIASPSRTNVELKDTSSQPNNDIRLQNELHTLKLDHASLKNEHKILSKANDELKASLEKEKEKISVIFNDESLIKLYYSKDWKHVLKFYSFKKKYLSNDSEISKKINGFIDLFKPGKKNRTGKYATMAALQGLQKNVDYTKILTIPFSQIPTVSIVIPVYNGWQMNYRCIKSIIEHTLGVSYEIILADDGSSDETKNASDKIENIIHIKNNVNLGFLQNCNHAAKSARGEFILFLNNDTEPMANWLAPLVELISSDTSIGMVGSKLVYPDGRLQEAGGIIWHDGSGWNYGRDQDPTAAQYNYVKEVDYISGASIMIRSNLWRQIGGFDERFIPAYCEDSDLAFAVRQAGYKVMYQPLSQVVHFESVSHGKEEKPVEGKLSIQSVRVLNQQKLYDKWKEVFIAEQLPNAEQVFHARERSINKKTILVIDHYVPQFDKDAGSKTVFQYLELLLALGLNVKFIGDNFYREEPYTSSLQQMGVEVLYGKWYQEHWRSWVIENSSYIDFIFLNRPHTSLSYITFLKQHTTAKILYYGHDLHFLRELRKYEIDKDPATLVSSNEWKSKEQFIYKHADYVLTPSADETEAIMKIDPQYKVITVLPYFFKEPAHPVTDFSQRTHIVFVGGFGHTPNVDGVLWFCKHVWPLVAAAIPGVVFTIVGSKPPQEINDLQSDNIKVPGFVSEYELQNLYKKTRLAVIPMRFGAGVKGKTVEAMSHGIPIVSTKIGLEGMPGILDFIQPFDDATSFAAEVIELYQDAQRLIKMSATETDFINKNFTWKAAFNQVKRLLDL